MPKQKTHSGAKKRFKVTGSGKILHERTNKRHLLEDLAALLVGVDCPLHACHGSSPASWNGPDRPGDESSGVGL